MNCIICGNKLENYFKKDFKGRLGLNIVYYEKCNNCEFFLSRTHYDLSDEKWNILNKEFHEEINKTEECLEDKNWINRLYKQSEMLASIKDKLGPKWLDWGCGSGILARYLSDNYHINVNKYDKYVRDEDKNDYIESPKKGEYDFVFSTSVFEHVRDRQTLEDINNLVSNTGSHGIHTFVRNDINNPVVDESWFYLLPVHCTFYSEKSMKVLFKEWNYKQCLYHEDTHFWILNKKEIIDVPNNIKAGNDFFL